MDWYSEIATLAYLDLEKPKVDIYVPEALTSALFLINPCVSQYGNIVIYRKNLNKLYDVKTEILDDGNVYLFGRVLHSLNVFKFIDNKDNFLENFIIVKNTKAEITKMLRDRIIAKQKERR